MSADLSKLKRPKYSTPSLVEETLEERGLRAAYGDRPTYQQNDYTARIIRAKRQDTRQKRLQQMLHELEVGGVYMAMKHLPSAKRRGSQ